MDIKNIIVKEYLESLTEKDELNRIFPLLLETRNFQILSKPKEYLGIMEYGKDIVAIGIDEDGIKKRFYFELKGGVDRDITEENFYGKDGIQDSLTQASYNKFVSSYPKFEHLPLKIIIVHNGIIKGTVQSTLENVFVQYSSTLENTTFERWDIHKLTLLFSQYLFSPYLLISDKSIRLLNRVLINLSTYEGILPDFPELIDSILCREKWKYSGKTISRKWKVVFESIKLLAFIIYSESKEHNNLDIAKRYLSQLVLKFWHWILVNKLEENKQVKSYFENILGFFFHILDEYFKRNLPVALVKDGVFFDDAGRYEQVGYTLRTFNFLEYFLLFLKMDSYYSASSDANATRAILVMLLNANNVSSRPLLDSHSITVVNILIFLIEQNDYKSARSYLSNIFTNLQWAKDSYNRLPDANNNIENVIRLIVKQEKSIYYSDSTSPLISVLLEFVALLNLEEDYYRYRDFILKHKIDLGVFVPHKGENSTSMELSDYPELGLEEQLFSMSFNDGYQSELRLTKHNLENGSHNTPIDFSEFKEKIMNRADEFDYQYRTDKAGYSFLKDLAHIFFQTPFFPDKWRKLQVAGS